MAPVGVATGNSGTSTITATEMGGFNSAIVVVGEGARVIGYISVRETVKIAYYYARGWTFRNALAYTRA